MYQNNYVGHNDNNQNHTGTKRRRDIDERELLAKRQATLTVIFFEISNFPCFTLGVGKEGDDWSQ